MSVLLFEVGCEELPASVCTSLERQLLGDETSRDGGQVGLVRRLLEQYRLWPRRGAQVRVLVSPRRVAVIVDGLPRRQTRLVRSFRGPRADVAFDSHGEPTKAGFGFARSRGLAPADLGRQIFDGVEFVVAEVQEAQSPAVQVVPQLCVDILQGLHVPRGMRWGTRPAGATEYLRFSRPIRWLVCKLDECTVPFPYYDLQAGDVSLGHRVLGQPVSIASAGGYEAALEDQGVIVDQARRRELITAGLTTAAKALGGVWSDPGDVLQEAVYLVEWPSVHAGRFDEGKLRLPAEVLITAMQSHQRYFPVRTKSGRLLPAFLYVSNADPQSADLITRGNERVLEGRLDDAEFAYDRDVAEGLQQMAQKLAAVVYHEKLGSLADKTLRLERSAAWSAVATVASSQTGAYELPSGARPGPQAVLGDEALQLADTLAEAARLAKADLVSGVVQEFPVLQGRMGGLYALADGRSEAVATAIAEHYLPLSASAPVPATLPGALLAIADKVDSIAGAWVVGEKPSGSRDPFGLRRAAMGIVRIALEYGLRLSLAGLLDEALDGYEGQGLTFQHDAVATEVLAFIRERLEVLLLDEGVEYEVVAAALGSSADDVPGLAARARGLQQLRGRAELLDAVVAYDRCASLAAKAGISAGKVSEELFTDDAEQRLYDAYGAVATPVIAALGDGDVERAVRAAAGLRAPVDEFFDAVLVMDGDPDVRQNRLAQLAAVRDLLLGIGDLSRVAS